MRIVIMYEKITQAIKVTVSPIYLEEQSNPDANHYIWAYHVAIENNSENSVKLFDRHWLITDEMGRRIEVHGKGVVGQQPVIQPGGCFEYTSGTPLNAPSGVMMGRYGMLKDDGVRFDVEIPPFSLDSPHQKRTVN
jgi:ApaG protein